VDAGERLVEDDDGRVTAREIRQPARVLDDLDRELRERFLGLGVAFGVLGRETALANSIRRRGFERSDADKRVQSVGIGLAFQRRLDPLTDLLDARGAARREERL